MIKAPISTIVNEAAKAPTIEQKVMILRKHDHPALRTYLKMALDKNLKWALPPGTDVPYTPCDQLDVEWVLYGELRRMYIFLPGGNPNLTDANRQRLFITLLESMLPADAEFLINVVNHKLPDGLDKKVVMAAFGPL
jgi:hypothetical protein